MDTYPITARSLERYFKVDGRTLQSNYKHHLSNFKKWSQKDHASDWVLLEQNIGTRLSIDETKLCQDLFTILSNKDGHGKQGSLIAVVRGTTAADVIEQLMQIPEDVRMKVEEVTMDFSDSMYSIVTKVFPKATIVIDCFHIMQRAGEALEEMRLKLKRLAQAEQRKQERQHKARLKRNAAQRRYYRKRHPKTYKGKKRGRKAVRANERFRPSLLRNGETNVELLTHVRYALLKSRNEWTDKQKERMSILFELNPRMEKAYNLVNCLRSIFRSRITKEEASVRLKAWYTEVGNSLIRELIAARDAIKYKEDEVLNYFINRSTNASAESLNSKMKRFRSQVRGVADLPFFMYRLCTIFG